MDAVFIITVNDGHCHIQNVTHAHIHIRWEFKYDPNVIHCMWIVTKKSALASIVRSVRLWATLLMQQRYILILPSILSRSLSFCVPLFRFIISFSFMIETTPHISCMHIVHDVRIRWQSQTNLCQNGKIHSRNPSLCSRSAFKHILLEIGTRERRVLGNVIGANEIL